MLYLGCHLSSAAGFAAMGKTALKINANTFQFFLRNPRGGAAKDIKPADVSEFLALAKQNGFGKILLMRRIRSIPVQKIHRFGNLPARFLPMI